MKLPFVIDPIILSEGVKAQFCAVCIMKNLRGFIATTISCVVAVSAAAFSGIRTEVYADIEANPVISRNCPAFSETSPYSATQANDAFYYSSWTGSAPDYLAYDLSAVPAEQRKKVIAVWYNATGNYDYTIGQYGGSSNGMPTDYTIEVNAAEGGDYPADGWVVVETVKENTLHSRQHVVDMSDYNWIRLNVTGVDGKTSGSLNINMDIHNVSNGITDSWIFFGDSITAGGMMNCYGTGYAELVNQIDSTYFPIQENGGIGGIMSTDGKNNIDRWLETFPGKYVSIAYGTNDSWGNQTGAEKYYENTVYMIEAVLAADMIPVLPKIPYATEAGVNTYLDDYNAMIDKIYEEYPEVVKGPDFDAMFRENPELLSGDGVHPSSEGYAAMRELWAETMYNTVYKGETPTEPQPELLIGDANCNGEVEVADAVFILQGIADPGNTDFELSETGHKQADADGNGSVDAQDALAIQQFKAGVVTELPIK